VFSKGAALWRVVADANVGAEGVLGSSKLQAGVVEPELAVFEAVDVEVDHGGVVWIMENSVSVNLIWLIICQLLPQGPML